MVFSWEGPDEQPANRDTACSVDRESCILECVLETANILRTMRLGSRSGGSCGLLGLWGVRGRKRERGREREGKGRERGGRGERLEGGGGKKEREGEGRRGRGKEGEGRMEEEGESENRGRGKEIE